MFPAGIGSTGVYLEADGASVDSWRALAITGQVAQPAAPVSLAEVRAEIGRLSKVAASMQVEAEAEKRRLGRATMALQAEASGDELLRA